MAAGQPAAVEVTLSLMHCSGCTSIWDGVPFAVVLALLLMPPWLLHQQRDRPIVLQLQPFSGP